MDDSPYYVYVSQNDDYYTVKNFDGKVLRLAKKRSVPEKYPAEISKNLKNLYKLLIISLIGLVLSGPLNIILFPFVVVNYRNLPPSETAYGLNVLFSFLVILFLSIILTFIFVLHVIY